MPQRLPGYVSRAFLPDPPKKMGVAVSGGSDSLALLHLLHDFCRAEDISLQAVTLDHQLRKGSAGEAATVAQICSKLGVPHQTLVWSDWSGAGNLQQQARNARYREIGNWARAQGIMTVAVGHTADDQAETVLMRLARRSGVDGLSGMRMRSFRDGINWVRPLLHTHRDVLQRYLTEVGVKWIDDPSNQDVAFDRIRVRQALVELAPLGIDIDALTDVAAQMSQARDALEWQTFKTAKELSSIVAGAVLFEEPLMRIQPDEIRRRLFVKAMNWVSGTTYPPRRHAVAEIMHNIENGQAGTADGCHIRRIGQKLWIFREYNAVTSIETPLERAWDNRWILVPPNDLQNPERLRVRALGPEGILQCPDWRDTGLPHPILLSTPAVWQEDTVIAAPLAGLGDNWHAELMNGEDGFYAGLLPH